MLRLAAENVIYIDDETRAIYTKGAPLAAAVGGLREAVARQSRRCGGYRAGSDAQAVEYEERIGRLSQHSGSFRRDNEASVPQCAQSKAKADGVSGGSGRGGAGGGFSAHGAGGKRQPGACFANHCAFAGLAAVCSENEAYRGAGGRGNCGHHGERSGGRSHESIAGKEKSKGLIL